MCNMLCLCWSVDFLWGLRGIRPKIPLGDPEHYPVLGVRISQNGALEYFTVASAKPGSTCEYLLTLRHMGTVEIHSLNRPGALAVADSLPDRAMAGRDSLPRTGRRSQTFTQTQLDNSASPRAAIAPAILRARRCSASTPETRTHYHGYHHERERMRFQVQR